MYIFLACWKFRPFSLCLKWQYEYIIAYIMIMLCLFEVLD